MDIEEGSVDIDKPKLANLEYVEEEKNITEITVIDGNLLEYSTEAIVISHNDEWKWGNEGLQNELAKQFDLKSLRFPNPNNCFVGTNFITNTSPKNDSTTPPSHSKWIHLVTHRIIIRENTIGISVGKLKELKMAVKMALTTAKINKVSEIAIPSIMARNALRYCTDDQIRQTIETACREWTKTNKGYPKKITIVNYTD